MYKIDFLTKTYIEIENPDEIVEGKTRIEWEKINTIEKEIGTRYFFQDNIPTIDSNYWTIRDNSVVEMDSIEKKAKDRLIFEHEWQFKLYPIRIIINKNLVKKGKKFHEMALDLILEGTPNYRNNDNLVVYLKFVNISDGFFLTENQTLLCKDVDIQVEQLTFNLKDYSGVIKEWTI